jgi:hypothetical protein
MIRSFQVLFRVTKIGVVSSHLYCFGQTDWDGRCLKLIQRHEKIFQKSRTDFIQIYERCLMQLDCYRKLRLHQLIPD